uniref:Uncharacterized protein n=1 Tax=Anguilla anguilla TaxID=7936 RepID=A0A0E9S7R4_ANGAN
MFRARRKLRKRFVNAL